MMNKSDDMATLKKLHDAVKTLKTEMARVIVGQEDVLDQILVTLFSGGHSLIEGVPGLAKTLIISTIAQAMHLKFSRIQFTPDLMPSDITGTEILQTDRESRARSLRFVEGPVFANVILADEINRTPPKTQSALLEAMQEHMVTVGNITHQLDEPFFVLATQNPIEQEGTYPLPEAQLDRFMLNIRIYYPNEKDEQQIVRQTTSLYRGEVNPVLTAGDILELQKLVRKLPVSDYVVEYSVKLARATRPKETTLEYIKRWIRWGAGPRASMYMVHIAKSKAAMDGRPTPTIDDIRWAAYPVLRHRLITSFTADAEGIATDDIIQKLLADIKE